MTDQQMVIRSLVSNFLSFVQAVEQRNEQLLRSLVAKPLEGAHSDMVNQVYKQCVMRQELLLSISENLGLRSVEDLDVETRKQIASMELPEVLSQLHENYDLLEAGVGEDLCRADLGRNFAEMRDDCAMAIQTLGLQIPEVAALSDQQEPPGDTKNGSGLQDIWSETEAGDAYCFFREINLLPDVADRDEFVGRISGSERISNFPDLAAILALGNDTYWWNDLEADVCEGNAVYIKTLQEWANITKGKVKLRDICETWSEAEGRMDVKITMVCNSHPFTLIPSDYGDFIDIGILEPLNHHIQDTGHRFEVLEMTDQTATVFFLTPHQRERLASERGWVFMDPIRLPI